MLTKRLKTIVSLVDTINVIDVGCDHALIDIYLTKYKNVKCTAIDSNKKVLKYTYENIEKYNMQDKIPVICNNGLDNIDIPCDTTIIIAGLGTKTIIDVLKNHHQKINDLIIQTNNDIISLRKIVVGYGFAIADEKIVKDSNKFYVVIKFVRKKAKYYYKEYVFGPIILKTKSTLKNEYINYLISKNEIILQNCPSKYMYKRLRIKIFIKQLKKLLN